MSDDITPTVAAATALKAELTRAVRGAVRFDSASQAMYSADASNYRHVPIGVVEPRDAEDAEAAMAVCREYGVAVLPVGARTSIGGQAVNTAVVLDFTKHMNRIVEIDPSERSARVQPGLVLDTLRDAVRAHGLTFGPRSVNAQSLHPRRHDRHERLRFTLDGLGGKTVDNVFALDVLTYRGERLSLGQGEPGVDAIGIPGALRDLRDKFADDVRSSFPNLTRRVSGYNLDQLLPENQFNLAKALVGTEGTCATVLEPPSDSWSRRLIVHWRCWGSPPTPTPLPTMSWLYASIARWRSRAWMPA